MNTASQKFILWLPYLVLPAVKDDVVLCRSMCQLDKVPAMFLWGTAVNADIVSDGIDTWETVSNLVNAHLEGILAHLQAERQAQEPATPFVDVEHCQV